MADGGGTEATEKEGDAAARLTTARSQLDAMALHATLASGVAEYSKRDGPLPASVGSIAALLLCAPALVDDESLRAALPHSADLLLLDEHALAGAAGEELREDLLAARVALRDMAAAVEGSCCAESTQKDVAECCKGEAGSVKRECTA